MFHSQSFFRRFSFAIPLHDRILTSHIAWRKWRVC
jgi:hypothetical protein